MNVNVSVMQRGVSQFPAKQRGEYISNHLKNDDDDQEKKFKKKRRQIHSGLENSLWFFGFFFCFSSLCSSFCTLRFYSRLFGFFFISFPQNFILN